MERKGEEFSRYKEITLRDDSSSDSSSSGSEYKSSGSNCLSEPTYKNSRGQKMTRRETSSRKRKSERYLKRVESERGVSERRNESPKRSRSKHCGMSPSLRLSRQKSSACIVERQNQQAGSKVRSSRKAAKRFSDTDTLQMESSDEMLQHSNKKRHSSKCNVVQTNSSPVLIAEVEGNLCEKMQSKKAGEKRFSHVEIKKRAKTTSKQKTDDLRWVYSPDHKERRDHHKSSCFSTDIYNSHNLHVDHSNKLSGKGDYKNLYFVRNEPWIGSPIKSGGQKFSTTCTEDINCSSHDQSLNNLEAYVNSIKNSKWDSNFHKIKKDVPGLNRGLLNLPNHSTSCGLLQSGPNLFSKKIHQKSDSEQYCDDVDAQNWYKYKEQDELSEWKGGLWKEPNYAHSVTNKGLNDKYPTHCAYDFSYPKANNCAAPAYNTIPPSLMTIPVQIPSGDSNAFSGKYLSKLPLYFIPPKFDQHAFQRNRQKNKDQQCVTNITRLITDFNKTNKIPSETTTTVAGIVNAEVSSVRTEHNVLAADNSVMGAASYEGFKMQPLLESTKMEESKSQSSAIPFDHSRISDLSEISDSDDDILNKGVKSKEDNKKENKNTWANRSAIEDTDLEEISDIELEEDVKQKRGISDALGVNWQGLITETRRLSGKNLPHIDSHMHLGKQRFQPHCILYNIGLSSNMLGIDLHEYNNMREAGDSTSMLLHSKFAASESFKAWCIKVIASVAFIQIGTREKQFQTTGIVSSKSESLSARHDLMLRRKLCDLPIKECHLPPRIRDPLKHYSNKILSDLWK